MKNILITGGAGFIGYHLANRLSQNSKNYVYIMDNLSRGKRDNQFKNLLKKKNIKFINKDLSKKIKIKLKKINTTYHLAAKVGVENVNKSPLDTFNLNLISLINVINFIKKNNINSKFVFFSTSEVYSPLIFKKVKNTKFTEKVTLLVNNDSKSRDSYYLSKLFGEKYLQLSNLKYLILRPHNVYGPRMGFAHVMPQLIKKIQTKKRIGVFSPNHSRAFCYIDDAISQIIFLEKNQSNGIFNIGNPDEEIKIFNLAKLIKNLMNSKSKLLKDKITAGSPHRRIPNINKLKNLGFDKKLTNLKIGLIDTISWYEKKKL